MPRCPLERAARRREPGWVGSKRLDERQRERLEVTSADGAAQHAAHHVDEAADGAPCDGKEPVAERPAVERRRLRLDDLVAKLPAQARGALERGKHVAVGLGTEQ